MGNYAIPGMDDDDSSSGSGLDTSNWGTWGSGIGGGIGIAGGIYSAVTGSQDAKKVADLQNQEALDEQRKTDLHRDAMRMASDRAQIQTVREAQFARSMATSIGQNQGAQLSSGLQGAYGTIGGTQASKQGAQSTALQFGNQLSEITDHLDLLKRQEADMRAKMSGDTAFGGLLGSVGKNLGNISSLAGLLLA